MTPKTFKIKSFGCQMNVYDGERMAELLGQQGMHAAAEGEDADLVVLNTCHIREKAADKAYSEVGRLRREDGSKPLIALAGCVAQAEGAEAKRRSPLIDIVVGPQAYHRLPEMIAETARGGAAGRYRHAGDLEVRRPAAAPPGAAIGFPHGAGRVRQILHLLRGALHPRRGDLAAVARHRRRSPGPGRRRRSRDRLARAECERVERWRARPRRAHSRFGQDRWAGAHPLHHQPPGRHERRADRRPWRGRQADALPASSGAIGQRPHPQGDEPQPHDPILSPHPGEGARRPPRHRAQRRLHRRLPGRDRGGFRSDSEHRRRSRLRRRLFVQIQPAAGHARRDHGGPDSQRSDGRAD